ncbi:MAG: alpha/beta fold hydrolase, partial [Oceanobacter sp.]
MKSSSQHFPVVLLRADRIGEFTEDTYLIRHRHDPDESVGVALVHLQLESGSDADKPPVVLIHSAFQNHHCWLGPELNGLGALLAREGYDVWMMEMRGHGHSPRNKEFIQTTLERIARYDLPAVAMFVEEKTAQRPVLVGHSAGGVTLATAVAAGWINADNCQALGLLGTQIKQRPGYLKVPLSGRGSAKKKDGIDGLYLNLGPELEPLGVIKEYKSRQGLFGKWRLTGSKDLLNSSWEQASLPLWGAAGVSDEFEPYKLCQAFFESYGSAVESE